MSVRAMHWVWEHSRATPTERLVLLAIADCANDRGEAWPSMAALVDKTRLSERTVQRAVATLVGLGELAAAIGGGRGKTTKYRLLPPSPAEKPRQENPVTEPETPSEKPRSGDAQSHKPRQRRQETPSTTTENPVTVTPGTIKEPSKEPSKPPNGGLPRASARETGTRLPDNFAATADMITWAKAETPLVGAKETAAFVDYWHAQPGAKGRKLDWPATWRNWMRRAQADAERRRGGGNSRASPFVERDGLKLKPETAQRLDDRARFEAMDTANQQTAIEGPT